ncbi:uncharacterized protein BDR25DRAFT_345395 [Lindgomyces ingoldianus]|uniref:Uncharacterized protein n=1 Tax=Lindgomyces ingoldianus TaxID=673940 RepID=A0ACB6QJW6_9PLEO|nr:uncharacterized protein BDR25DRAFT_345395 [Lindgomyces ingoldianus]KAF2466810.1 hypothetical protein BDR25DRAFT_345395 [Lindgomyces ingoldianus]
MDFAFKSAVGSAPSINAGADLTEINTENLGFAAFGGEKKLQLLPDPWPTDGLPPSTASLLSVASRRGLLAAASPRALVLASTEAVRKAFNGAAPEDNIITDFKPDVVVALPQLRHVAFSSNEDFLVVTAESGGGLAVYGVDDLLRSKAQPGVQISTEQITVRSLAANPNPDLEQAFVVVLDSGQLLLADVGEGQSKILQAEGVSCAGWSAKGKQIVAGLNDGTALQYTLVGKVVATIPRPPGVEANYAVSAIYWLTNDEFFVIHSPPTAPSADDDAMQDNQESTYHLVKTDQGRTTFSFHKASYAICPPSFGPQRDPPLRFSITRLRNWEPHLRDVLILGASNCVDFTTLTSASAPLAPTQEVLNDFTITDLQDNRRATLPQMTGGEDGVMDSVTIGEALDLSSKEKILRPIPMDEEIAESPTPLPAFLALNNQGRLSAWWIVYDKSIREGTGYHGLTALSKPRSALPTPISNPSSNAPSSTTGSVFAKPTATFGVPSTPKFGSTSFSNVNAASSKPAQPAFGTASAIGGISSGSGFGSTGAIGIRQSPWAAASQTPASQPQHNPFPSAVGSSSGFAKFGGGTAPGTGSPFSSFGSVGTAQSPFASLGQQKPAQPAFAGTSKEITAPKGLTTQPSFGSTVTVGSSLGGGSTLPSWANTPAQQGDSIFGQRTSSFASTKESDMGDSDDAEKRERDEATPTPQAPPPQPKGLFGLSSNGFNVGSSFKGDGTAKDDLPRPISPSSGSLFGGDFASALGAPTMRPPETPIKKEEVEPSLQEISTTPASPPKSAPSTLFSSTTPKAPIAQKETPISPSDEAPATGEDAPLPPDPMTWKPPQKADDDLPPLAGSPGIKVEAPDSSVPSSDDDGGENLSIEEQDEDEEEPSPSDAARKSRPLGARYTLQDSINQSPRIFPAAPTPPVIKSSASSRSGNDSRGSSRPPVPPNLFGQTSRPAASLFGQSSTPTGFPRPPAMFAPQPSRAQELRSPSPVRSASTSAIGTRQPVARAQNTIPLAGSTQQMCKPQTSQPEVSDLSDDEDERIRQELASDIVPSWTLDPFLAHHDYTGSVTKSGIPGQIELMYRDINSMVDTLGLNARTLTAFIKYHCESTQDSLARNDLQEIEDQGEQGPWYKQWALGQMDDLRTLAGELEQVLEAGKTQHVFEKLAQLARLLSDGSKLSTKLNEVRREIINRKDPERTETLRKASLPKEQADQQRALRTQYANLLSLLSKVEEAVVVLRSKLAAHNAVNGKTAAVPTVDAVKKTINKMIAMTEKKNSDILLLEAQMRKIGLEASSRPTSPSSRTFGTPSRSRALRSRDSEFTTPPTNRSKMSTSELNRRAMTPDEDTPSRGFGLFYTPNNSPTQNGGHRKLDVGDLDGFDIEALRESALRRKKVAEALTDALLIRGVKFTKVN